MTTISEYSVSNWEEKTIMIGWLHKSNHLPLVVHCSELILCLLEYSLLIKKHFARIETDLNEQESWALVLAPILSSCRTLYIQVSEPLRVSISSPAKCWYWTRMIPQIMLLWFYNRVYWPKWNFFLLIF